MIDSAKLANQLEAPLKALAIDAGFFQQAGDFSVYDCYPTVEGQLYRIKTYVDLAEEKIEGTTFFLRISQNGGDHVDHEVDPSSLPQSVQEIGKSFVDVIYNGVGELAQPFVLKR